MLLLALMLLQGSRPALTASVDHASEISNT